MLSELHQNGNNRWDGQDQVVSDQKYEMSSSGNRKLIYLVTRVLKTVALFLSWCCLGMYSEILGPSMQTFIDRSQSSTEKLGLCLSLREVGMFFGSLGGALVADRWARNGRHWAMIATLLLGSATMALVPSVATSLPALATVLLLSGCAHGAMTANGNPLLNSIWLEKSGGPFNLMHAGYGVGAAVAPGLLEPFTYRLVPPNATTLTEEEEAKLPTFIHLHVPYYVVAGLCTLCAGLFCSFKFCGPNEKEKIEESEVSRDSENSHHEVSEKGQNVRAVRSVNALMRHKLVQDLVSQKTLLLFILVPTLLLYAALVGNERVFSKFFFVFANEGPARLTPKQCFLLSSVYWVVFALARMTTVFASIFIPITALFGIQLVGAWAMALGLYLAPASLKAYTAFTVCFALFKSPLFPTALGVISLVAPVTGVVTFFVNLGSSVGASSMQAIAGRLLDTHGRQVFPLIVMVSGAALILFGAALVTSSRLYDRRCRTHRALTSEPPQREMQPISLSGA